MPSMQPLKAVPDDELLHRLGALLRDSRHTEAELVAHIGEVDARRLYVREAVPSMFQYCTERLHLSGAEAYLRIAAARASREHPVILAMLADGRLHLTAIAMLAPHLTPGNRDSLLDRATHKTKREIEELLAEVAPRPDAPALIRKLPERRSLATMSANLSTAPLATAQTTLPSSAEPSSAEPSTAEPSTAEPPTAAPSSGAPSPETRPEPLSASAAPQYEPDTATHPTQELRPDGVASSRPGRGDARPAVIEPLAPCRYKVQFTASAELRDKLERLQALMRSSVPDGDLAAIIDAAVTEKLERLEAQRFARTKSPRMTVSGSDTSPRTRRVPASVKRAVHERDENRCRYVDEQGRRCTARAGLEFHHRHPFGLGGGHSPANISLLCHAHNHHRAEIDYGHQAIARHCRNGPVAPSRSPSRREGHLGRGSRASDPPGPASTATGPRP